MEEALEVHSEPEWLFCDLYKYNGKHFELSQEQRREKFLEEQKQKRHLLVDKNRQLCDLFLKEIDLIEEMECDPEKPSLSKKINFKLMQSEWFTDIPNDLEDNWLVKFCPQGFRVLVVARKHITTVYTEQRRIVLRIKSHFPGGGGTRNESNGITVLDCIYNKFAKTIFILDCLFWNSMSLLDGEVNFRFFWLKSKFEEEPQLAKYLSYNFILLGCIPAQRPLIQDEMFNLLPIGDQKIPYDGVVFYYKESHYIFGCTPLVGWLASYMLPEKLHIDVCPENLLRKPKDYINMESYLENLKNKKKRRRLKTPVAKNLEMDVQ